MLLQPGRFNQFRERIKDPVGRGQVLDTGVWILKAEAGHAGCPGRCASVAGIFYDKAFPRVGMQAPGGFEKNVGRRFWVWDALAAEEDVEILADGELLHAELDVLLGRRRRDRQMKALTVQKRDRFGDSFNPGNPIGSDDFVFNFAEPFHNGRITPEIPSVSLIDETAEILACGADTALVAVVLQNRVRYFSVSIRTPSISKMMYRIMSVSPVCLSVCVPVLKKFVYYHTTKPDAQKVQQGKYFVVKKAKMRYNYSINADGKKDFIGKYVQKDVII